MTSLALLIDQLFSPVPGGMGTYVRELVPALTRADPSLSITLFHARFDEPVPEPWTAGYPVETIDAPIRTLYPEWALLRRPTLPPGVAACDIVHSPVPAAAPPAATGQKLVVTVHDIAFLVQPKHFPRQWRLMYRAGLSRAVRSADAIITPSRHTAEDLARHTKADLTKVHVVPLASSLPTFDSDVDARLARLKVPRPYVLFVGTLEPRKNLVRLVRAYRRMALRGLPHALVLAGPVGWGHQALMRELSLEGPGDVVLTGSVEPPGLDALYRGTDLFVYPSLYEGFGLPVLEAMARGAACVVSTSSSLPEVAGEAALPVDPRSVGGLAEAMERVLTNPELAERLRQVGRARAAQFSWDQTAVRTLGVYKAIL
jgi:glycosyltransferase involved in cell wall biosynthesis